MNNTDDTEMAKMFLCFSLAGTYKGCPEIWLSTWVQEWEHSTDSCSMVTQWSSQQL